jgi:acyl-CoA synthetase (AMP-forming)/AMP-acid ligase II
VPLYLQTIIDHLELRVEKDPSHVAFIFNQNDGLNLTYKDIKDKSVVLAQNMMRMGLKKGDRVIISLPITYELVIIYFACAYTGVIAVPIDAEYVLFGDLEYAFSKAKPAAFFLWDSNRFDKYRSINAQILNDLLSLDETKEYLKNLIILGEPQNVQKYHQYSFDHICSYDDIALKRNGFTESEDMEYPYIDMDDTYFIMFTSGTTSKKKGVVIRHNMMDYQRIASYHSSKKTPRKIPITVCVAFPIYHLSGMMSVTNGVVVPSTVMFPSYELNPIDVMKAVDKYQCSFLAATPKM